MQTPGSPYADFGSRLSAVLAAEWTSSAYRARLASAVFLMHSLGPLLVQLVGLAVLSGWGESHQLSLLDCGLDAASVGQCRLILDGAWRIIMGVGLVPVVLSLGFSISLPESALYRLEMRGDPISAFDNLGTLYEHTGRREAPGGIFPAAVGTSSDRAETGDGRRGMSNFINNRSGLLLLGTCMTGFLVELAFSGLSLDYGRLLRDIWSAQIVPSDASRCLRGLPDNISAASRWPDGLLMWQTTTSSSCESIRNILIHQPGQYVATVSVGSVIGALCAITVGDNPPRTRFLTISILITSILFLASGLAYVLVHHSPAFPTTIFTLGLSHFALYFGKQTRLPARQRVP